MKKGILLLLTVGTMVVTTSCGADNSKEAATEICKCYENVMALQKETAEASNTEEMFAAVAKTEEAIKESDACHKKWDEKFNGKTDIEAFKKELKAQNEEIYNLMDEKGLF